MSATDVRAMLLFTLLVEKMNSALPEANQVTLKAHKRWATLRCRTGHGQGEIFAVAAAGTRVGARFRLLPRSRRAVPDAIRFAEAVLSTAYRSTEPDYPRNRIIREADRPNRRFQVEASIIGDAMHISWVTPPDTARNELEPLPLSLF
jgi:hypothetical protein